MEVDEKILQEKQRTDDVSTPEQCWRGCTMEQIHRNLNEFELDHVAAVQPSVQDHTVLHFYPIRTTENEPPRPLRAHHKWDSCHVRLPCSPKSQYPIKDDDGSVRIESRWEMIERALLQPITNSQELQAAILSYNTKYEQQWNFSALHKLFDTELDDSESRVFFEDLLPRIIRLALRLPELVQAPIPLLKQGQNHSITLTQQQVSCLLANAFLCTFPRRNTLKQKSEYSTFPDINFNRLFQSHGQKVLEKLKCICHYFRRVCPTERDSSNVPTGVVTFTRRSLAPHELTNWANCAIPLGSTPLHITSAGTIEDQGFGLLQVDFANKFLGGGVLDGGCVQEEIRFVICPELLISKLFTECLRPTEALVMIGCERYSNYSGYASTFEWSGNHDDCTPRDSSRRLQTTIVAIDALYFQTKSAQYREELMLRELNKAYVGFLHPLPTLAPGVASGNWGCGAFGGDAKLKALLQLMVCTVVKRPLVYYTFGNAELRDVVYKMYKFFIEKNVLVRDLWNVLRRFQAQKLRPEQLYDFIYKELSNGNECSTVCAGSMPSNGSDSALSNNSNNKKNNAASGLQNQNKNDVLETSSSELEKEVHEILVSDDDDETNALLVAAAQAVEDKETSPTSAVDNSATIATPSKGMRQRTLLEMLDQCYTEGTSSKRHCQDKSDGTN